MNINKSQNSPNFDNKEILPEFVVIHYTACSLQSTFDIFKDPQRKVSSHLVISEEGEVFEIVQCWDQPPLKAWHAGESTFSDGTKTWQAFNDFSIGIELVNLNGNLLPFSEKQYTALVETILHFKQRFPALLDPARIVGHEQIAGFRGKVDPGWLFDWSRLFSACYPNEPQPERKPRLAAELREVVQKFVSCLSESEIKKPELWQALSSTLETAAKLQK